MEKQLEGERKFVSVRCRNSVRRIYCEDIAKLYIFKAKTTPKLPPFGDQATTSS